MKSKLFLSALTLLGFGGCSEGGGLFNESEMYGVPIVDYRFMGAVRDAEGNPVKGIDVKISSAEKSVTTDEKGAFKTDFSGYADGFHSVVLTDTDGAANGGEFAKKVVEVNWEEAERVGKRDVFDLGVIELEEQEE